MIHEFDRNAEIVAIGGGNGLSTLLSGLKAFAANKGDVAGPVGELSAIVAVSDDGGSSGRLRDELDMPPPGDIRNCLVSLSEDSHLLSRLFRHRFSGEGELAGHNFGNLFLAALSEVTGDFSEAVRLSAEILATKGHLYPATSTNVRIAARTIDGETIKGETKIGKCGKKIERLFLEPAECEPLPAALEAINKADLITVGPGSLYTSIMPPLLVPGIRRAMIESDAVKVFICNLMTQPGETDGMTGRRHLEVVKEHIPELQFDFLVVNDRVVSERQADLYLREGAEQIGVHGSMNEDEIEGAAVIKRDLLDSGEKVRHDPAKLARTVLGCIRNEHTGMIQNSGAPEIGIVA